MGTYKSTCWTSISRISSNSLGADDEYDDDGSGSVELRDWVIFLYLIYDDFVLLYFI